MCSVKIISHFFPFFGNVTDTHKLSLSFPLEENLPYDKISILVAPDSGLVKRISIHHKLGNVTTITFQGMKTGVKLKDELFEWDIPEGTEVIEP